MKVLLIESSSELRDFMCAVLLRESFEVVTATNELEGLTVARREVPDVIALDLGMPFLQRIEACRLFMQDPAVSGIPIVIMSDSQDRAIWADIKTGGAIGRIPRTFNAMTLACELLVFVRLAKSNPNP